MRKTVRILFGVAVVCLAAGCLSCGERADLPSGFVHVTERVPDAILEIRYHSTYNFVGKRIDGWYLAPEAMVAAGFKPLAEEWWHFTLKDEPYPDRYFDFPVR